MSCPFRLSLRPGYDDLVALAFRIFAASSPAIGSGMSDALELPPAGSEGPANARSLVVQEFARASRDARDLDRLRELFRQAVRALGFDYFLLQGDTGHAWLADVPPGWTMAAVASGDAVVTTAL